jgi:hypothetical protein
VKQILIGKKRLLVSSHWKLEAGINHLKTKCIFKRLEPVVLELKMTITK